tara:strand:+ start:839 stop:1006 length:168 start_codon:yes stop_codon:yes gene_type:complete
LNKNNSYNRNTLTTIVDDVSSVNKNPTSEYGKRIRKRGIQPTTPILKQIIANITI